MNINYVDSSVSSEYVSPLFPKVGENVSIKIRFKEDLDVKCVSLCYNFLGVIYTNEMEYIGDGYYKSEITAQVKHDYNHYFFHFDTEGRTYYFARNYLDVIPPPVKSQFILRSSISEPTWIASSTCYQIFPDRFCNGDPNVGATPDMYEFDGGKVSVHDFSEIPAAYEEARCIDFYNGDLKGIADKADYLKELGVTSVYINPIGASLTIHRFDCIDFFQIDEKLGGNEALSKMVDVLHKAGIKVIIDISINHTGSAHPWFIKAKEDPNSTEAGFYYKKDDGDFVYWANVKTLPQLNYNSQELRDIIYRNDDSVLKQYMKEPYNIDGWRLDVAPELGRCGKDQLTHELWREVRNELKPVKDEFYLVGEDWQDAYEYLTGDMWDATMNYVGSGRPFRSWIGESDRYVNGYWGHSPRKVQGYNANEMCKALNIGMETQVDQLAYFRMNLFDSHDTPRLHNNKDVMDEDIYNGILMLMYLMPGMPNMYYGDEISLNGRLHSVEGSRYPMEWDEKKWDLNRKALVTKLGMLRKHYSFLSFASVKYIPLSENAFAMLRYTKDEAMVAIINKEEEDLKITLDSFLLNFTTAEDMITESFIHTFNGKTEISLKAKKSTVLYFHD